MSSFDTIKQLIKRYKLKSIFFVYFKRIFFIISVPFLVLSLLVTIYCVYRMNNLSKNQLCEKAELSAAQLEDLFDELDKYQYQFELDNDIYNLAVSGSSKDAMNVAICASNTAALTMRTATYSNFVENVHVYFPYIAYVISKNESNILKNYSNSKLFSDLDNLFARSFITDNENQLFRCIYPIVKNASVYAYVVYDIPLDDLKNLYPDLDILIIRSDSNEIIYRSDGIEPDNLREHFSELNQNAGTPHSYNGRTMLSSSISNGQFCVIFSNPVHSSMSYYLMFAFAVLILFVFIIALAAACAFYFSTHFYNIIADMLQMVDSFGFDIDSQKNEVQFIEKFFSTVIEKNKDIEKTIIEKSYELKQAQAQALQLQINPHFIFNTLNLANVIIMREMKRSNDAEIVIYHLANLIAKILDTKNPIISVNDEINSLNEFIEIEKIRFNNNFDVFFDISDEIYDKNILSFTLQPIVENAFEHGIKLLDNTRGILKIVGRTEEGYTVFEITNTGPEMDLKCVEKINAALRSLSSAYSHGHIGLLNVHKRINLLCGSECGVSVSANGNIFCVRMRYKL